MLSIHLVFCRSLLCFLPRRYTEWCHNVIIISTFYTLPLQKKTAPCLLQLFLKRIRLFFVMSMILLNPSQRLHFKTLQRSLLICVYQGPTFAIKRLLPLDMPMLWDVPWFSLHLCSNHIKTYLVTDFYITNCTQLLAHTISNAPRAACFRLSWLLVLVHTESFWSYFICHLAVPPFNFWLRNTHQEKCHLLPVLHVSGS